MLALPLGPDTVADVLDEKRVAAILRLGRIALDTAWVELRMQLPVLMKQCHG